MTGDWGGARSKMIDSGVEIDLTYTFNAAANVSGGISTLGAYCDDASLWFHFDLEKIASIPGTKVHVLFNSRYGASVTDRGTGALFQSQQLFGGGELPRLGEFSLEVSLFDDMVDIKAGRIFGGGDFGSSPLYGSFMTQAMDGNFGSFGKNINLSFYPVASWGGQIQVHPSPNLLIQAGAFEANPTLSNKYGFNWTTNGATGVIFATEFWFLTEGIRDWLPGHYKLGFYYDTSDRQDNYLGQGGGPFAITGAKPKEHDSTIGAYGLYDQMVWRDPNDKDSWLILLGGTEFTPDNVNFMPFFSFGGLLWNQPIPGRTQDTVGFAICQGLVSPDIARTQRLQGVPQQTYEIVMEWNYGLQAAGWLRLLPNVQYIVNPGGTGDIENALALGVQTSITF